MKNLTFKFILSTLALYSIVMTAITAQAAPIQFNQVVQVVDAKPGKATNGGFAKLRLNDDFPVAGDDTTKTDTPKPQQDDRVITETKSEIVENDVCDCTEAIAIPAGGFPYGWLALGGVPFLFLIPPGDNPNDSPSPTPSDTTTPPTTATPTPPMTPTPTPPTEPTPEPMTILLFGTGLAGVGIAARRKLGKKDKQESSAS